MSIMNCIQKVREESKKVTVVVGGEENVRG